MSREVIERLYDALNRHDGDAMAACYAPEARFHDPAFGELTGAQPGAMWRMLTGRSTDLLVELAEHDSDGRTGSAHWIASYTFSTGRRVVNDVHSRFRFEDALIAEQDDSFSFFTWSRQALGPVGLLLGWTPVLRATVNRKARGDLDRFMAAG